MERNPVNEARIIKIESGSSLCYDHLTGRYFEGDLEKIRQSVNDLNHMITHDGYASMNNFYNFLGIPDVPIGDDLGWNSERLLEVEFLAHLGEDGRPALGVVYRPDPKPRYDKIY